MNANELLRSVPQYRLILASHVMLQRVGYSSEDIYVFIGKNPCVILKRDGLEFVFSVGGTLSRPFDRFCSEWKYISSHTNEVGDEVANQSRDEWLELFSLAQLLMAIRMKGIRMPGTDRNDRQTLH